MSESISGTILPFFFRLTHHVNCYNRFFVLFWNPFMGYFGLLWCLGKLSFYCPLTGPSASPSFLSVMTKQSLFLPAFFPIPAACLFARRCLIVLNMYVSFADPVLNSLFECWCHAPQFHGTSQVVIRIAPSRFRPKKEGFVFAPVLLALSVQKRRILRFFPG